MSRNAIACAVVNRTKLGGSSLSDASAAATCGDDDDDAALTGSTGGYVTEMTQNGHRGLKSLVVGRSAGSVVVVDC